MIPVAYLRECFDADFEAGTLTWRQRPLSHFPNKAARAKWNGHYAGTPTGHQLRNRYTSVVIRFRGERQQFYTHRVMWALAHGRWPKEQIDHINGMRTDNRLANLREATNAENNQNRIGRSSTGVYKTKRGRWRACICKNGKALHIRGTFTTQEDAHAAYLRAKAEIHLFQPEPRLR